MSKNADYSFIRYSNCWEDTDILLKGLDIKPNEIGLSIASGGDNTLALLLKNPKKVYAFDLNKTQLYCLELKIICFKNLSYKEIISFLGINNDYDRLTTYNKIKSKLSSEARTYFNNNIKIIKTGIIHIGRFERYFQLFRKYIIPLISNHKNFYDFSQMEDLKKQKYFYENKINNKRLKILFKIYFGSKIMGSLGRDKSYYKYVEDKKESGKDIKLRFEYGISNTINKTNPYLNYILNNNFFPESLPTYLKEKNYKIIKKNIDKISIIYGNLLSITNLKFDFFNLSDIFEYMSDEEFNQNIKKIKSLSNNNARIVYWNMQNKRYINDNNIKFNKELSSKLFKKNKSYFYRNFLVYQVRNKQ